MTSIKITADIFVAAALLACSAACISASAADNDTPELLKNGRAVQIYENTAYYSGEKTEMFFPAIIRDDSVLLSESDFESLFSVNITASGNSIVIDGSVEMTIGSYTFIYGSENYSLDAAPEITDGILYLPVDEYGSYVYGSGYNNDGHGMIYTGIDTENYNKIKESNLYLFFERKTPAELKNEFLRANDDGSKHPRLIADSTDFSRIAAEIKSDPVKSEWYSKVIYTANSILDQSVVEYKISGGKTRIDLHHSSREPVLRKHHHAEQIHCRRDDKLYAHQIHKLRRKLPEHSVFCIFDIFPSSSDDRFRIRLVTCVEMHLYPRDKNDGRRQIRKHRQTGCQIIRRSKDKRIRHAHL